MNLSFILILVFAAGCSGLSKDDCIEQNWFVKGEEDGSRGEASDHFIDYSQQCQKHQVRVSQRDYFGGHKTGLDGYCSYKVGYREGLEGKPRNTICDKIRRDYRTGHEVGTREQQQVDMMKEERRKGVRNILLKRNSKECSFADDCLQDGHCHASKCHLTNEDCTFHSDCKIKGRCIEESEYVHGGWVRVNLCEF